MSNKHAHKLSLLPLAPSLYRPLPSSAIPPLAAVATLFLVGTSMLALLLEETSLLPALPPSLPPWLFFWLLCEGIFYMWLKRLRRRLDVLTSPQR